MTYEPRQRHRENLYDLTPSEFEGLVAEVFAQSGYSDVRIAGGPGDQGVDILATKEAQTIAIQVKHKVRITLADIQRFVHGYFSNPSTPRHLIFVTSARLPQNFKTVTEGLPEGAQLELLGREDLEQMLAKHATVFERFQRFTVQRLKSERQRLIWGSIGGLASIIGALLSIYLSVFLHKAPLDQRIETVEKALVNIKDLESYLSDIKKDMIDKQKATEVINQKYAQAKELEKLTDAQLFALQATLQTHSWRRTIFNYAMGFVLGVASSFLGSVLYSRWKQRRALE